jgi:hypothetical protein
MKERKYKNFTDFLEKTKQIKEYDKRQTSKDSVDSMLRGVGSESRKVD